MELTLGLCPGARGLESAFGAPTSLCVVVAFGAQRTVLVSETDQHLSRCTQPLEPSKVDSQCRHTSSPIAIFGRKKGSAAIRDLLKQWRIRRRAKQGRTGAPQQALSARQYVRKELVFPPRRPPSLDPGFFLGTRRPRALSIKI